MTSYREEKRRTSRLGTLRAIGILILSLTAPGVALAHAGLVRSSPAAGAHLTAPPSTVQLWFSEDVELTMTSLTVTGPGNVAIALAAVRAVPGNGRSLTAMLTGALAPGQYTVTWRTVAADDGHPSHGAFDFFVRSASPASTGATVRPSTGSGVIPAGVTTPHALAMDVEAPSYVVARWASYVALIVLMGVVAFRALVLPRVRARANSNESFNERVLARGASLGLYAAIAFVAASIARFYAERAVVRAVVGAGAGTDTILGSSWGRVWLAQVSFAVAACVVFALARKWKTGAGGDAVWAVAAVVAAILGATPAFSGHAAAASAHHSLSIALDIVHVLSAGGWLGSLLVLVLVAVPCALTRSAEEGGVLAGGSETVAELVRAFSPTALVFASMLVATGAVTAWLRIGSIDALFHSPYGAALLLKLALVCLVLAAGAFNWLRVRTALQHPDQTVFATRRLRQSGRLELVAGLLVIGVTAVLVALQPPMQ